MQGIIFHQSFQHILAIGGQVFLLFLHSPKPAKNGHRCVALFYFHKLKCDVDISMVWTFDDFVPYV
ncbi:hypothetical protein CV945_16205 [Geobacillus sp. Manikaran-105]|nr:hypothetical protein GLN3_00350 [Geobacillus lituanicus]PJW13081.1 hypothetical protein CV945_16205 [Geobacillus sp. Manikaran-105]